MAGINGDTPLGYTVQIRAETDQKRIREMTAHEKEIRRKWKEFRQKQHKENLIYVSKENIDKVLSGIFR